MPRLSVVMPMFNAEHTIVSAARSTLRSMPSDAELVVIDDGSTDDSVGMLATVEDSRVRLLSSPTSLGVGGAINKALESVDSELVGRMDADDICLPWRFTLQLRRMTGGLDVSFGQVVRFRRSPARLGMFAPAPISTSAMPFHLLVFNPVAHPTMVARTEAIRDVGGYRQVPAEDYDLWLRMATAGHTMERLGAPIVALRTHGSQVTGTADWRSRPPLDGDPEPYRQLCRLTLGQDPAWYPNPRRNRQSAQSLRMMSDAITRSSRNLSGYDRRFLDAKLRSISKLAVEPDGAPR